MQTHQNGVLRGKIFGYGGICGRTSMIFWSFYAVAAVLFRGFAPWIYTLLLPCSNGGSICFSHLVPSALPVAFRSSLCPEIEHKWYVLAFYSLFSSQKWYCLYLMLRFSSNFSMWIQKAWISILV